MGITKAMLRHFKCDQWANRSGPIVAQFVISLLILCAFQTLASANENLSPFLLCHWRLPLLPDKMARGPFRLSFPILTSMNWSTSLHSFCDQLPGRVLSLLHPNSFLHGHYPTHHGTKICRYRLANTEVEDPASFVFWQEAKRSCRGTLEGRLKHHVNLRHLFIFALKH